MEAISELEGLHSAAAVIGHRKLCFSFFIPIIFFFPGDWVNYVMAILDCF